MAKKRSRVKQKTSSTSIEPYWEELEPDVERATKRLTERLRDLENERQAINSAAKLLRSHVGKWPPEGEPPPSDQRNGESDLEYAERIRTERRRARLQQLEKGDTGPESDEGIGLSASDLWWTSEEMRDVVDFLKKQHLTKYADALERLVGRQTIRREQNDTHPDERETIRQVFAVFDRMRAECGKKRRSSNSMGTPQGGSVRDRIQVDVLAQTVWLDGEEFGPDRTTKRFCELLDALLEADSEPLKAKASGFQLSKILGAKSLAKELKRLINRGQGSDGCTISLPSLPTRVPHESGKGAQRSH